MSYTKLNKVTQSNGNTAVNPTLTGCHQNAVCHILRYTPQLRVWYRNDRSQSSFITYFHSISRSKDVDVTWSNFTLLLYRSNLTAVSRLLASWVPKHCQQLQSARHGYCYAHLVTATNLCTCFKNIYPGDNTVTNVGIAKCSHLPIEGKFRSFVINSRLEHNRGPKWLSKNTYKINSQFKYIPTWSFPI